VSGLEKFGIELVEGYFKGKKIYEKVFPKFYDSIAERVVRALQSKYPEIEPAIGPRDRARALTRFPEKGENIPLDWVAFGFYGLDLYDFHIGVILLMEDWPVKYHTGLHVMENVWKFIKEDTESIDWKKKGDLVSSYIFAAHVLEHRFLDPTRELNFNDLKGEEEYISNRVIQYYEASAPVALKLAKIIQNGTQKDRKES